MIALSMMQPFAWLFVNGYLTIDDRSRGTAVRGQVAIHASKRFHGPYYDFIRAHTAWPLPGIHEFQHGGVIGVANLVNCLAPAVVARPPDLRRAHFGAPGFYGLVFESPESRPFVECRGNVGFFRIPDGIWTPQSLSSSPI